MRNSRFSEAQIIGILKELKAGKKGATLCREHGISEATLYSWRSKYAGLGVSDLVKLRQLEDENRRLKKIVADQALKHRGAQDRRRGKLLRPAQRRAAVQAVRDRLGAKERPVCRWLCVNRKLMSYLETAASFRTPRRNRKIEPLRA